MATKEKPGETKVVKKRKPKPMPLDDIAMHAMALPLEQQVLLVSTVKKNVADAVETMRAKVKELDRDLEAVN